MDRTIQFKPDGTVRLVPDNSGGVRRALSACLPATKYNPQRSTLSALDVSTDIL